jgi:hypothetical protein
MTNNRNINVNKSWTVIAATLCLLGCKSRQEAGNTFNIAQNPPATEQTVRQEIPYDIKNLDYQWITYRATASVCNSQTGKEQMSVNLFFVNRKDSIIFITINKILEGARIVLTPDSVKFANHLTSSFYAGDYGLMKKLTGFSVDFYLVQSLLTGNDFVGFSGKYSQTTTGDTVNYHFHSRKHDTLNLTLKQDISVHKDSRKICTNQIWEKQTLANIMIAYGNFTSLGGQDFTGHIVTVIPQQELLLRLTIKDVKINIPGPTGFRIPDKYKRMEL